MIVHGKFNFLRKLLSESINKIIALCRICMIYTYVYEYVALGFMAVVVVVVQ